MGLVRRQSTLNTIYAYLGVALGVFSKLVMFNAWLTKGEYGLVEILATVMVLGAEVSLLGIPNGLIRFFPYFRGHATKEGQFVFFTFVYAIAGYLLLAIGLYFAEPWIVSAYEDTSPLFAGSYGYIFLVILGYAGYRYLSALSQGVFKSVIPQLSFNVILKLVQMALVAVFHFEWFGFDLFILLLSLSYSVPAVIIAVYLIWLGKIQFRWDWGFFKSRALKLVLNFSLFASLGQMASIMVNRLDMLMIALLLGEEYVASYAIGFYLISFISMPGRSMSPIVMPIMAEDIKQRNWGKLRDLYQRVSLNIFLIGTFLFMLIWSNLTEFFELTPKHAIAADAVVYLGLTVLVGYFTGAHRLVIINSKFYRFDLYANFSLLVLSITTNYLLIPILGITGAALATCISIFLYNVAGMFWVYRKFNLFAPNRQMLLTILLGAICLFVGKILPVPDNPWLSVPIRSAIVGPLFLGGMFLLNLSPDLKQLALLTLQKALTILGLKK